MISKSSREQLVESSASMESVEFENGNPEGAKQNMGMDETSVVHVGKDSLKPFEMKWSVENKGSGVGSTELAEGKPVVDLDDSKSKEMNGNELVSSCTGVECGKDSTLNQSVQGVNDSGAVLESKSAGASNEMKSLSTQSESEESKLDDLQTNSNDFVNDESKLKSNANAIQSLSMESSSSSSQSESSFSSPSPTMRKRRRRRGRVFSYNHYRRHKQNKPAENVGSNTNNNPNVGNAVNGDTNKPTKASHGEFFLGDTERIYNTRYKQAIRNAMRSNSNYKSSQNKNSTSPPRPTAPPKNYSFAEDYDKQPMKLLVLLSSMEPDTVVPLNSIHS